MSSPALVGVGAYLPPHIRTNDDPIFDPLKALQLSSTLFDGLCERRIVGPRQTLKDLMLPACQQALEGADLSASAVDALIGYGSVSEYIAPSMLSQIHDALSLRDDVPVIPIGCEFNNFNASLLMADALIQSGRYRTILVACASNWTQYMNYLTPQSAYAGDGAGAAVMSLSDDPRHFRVVDMETFANTANYGQMYMAADGIGLGAGAGTIFNSPTYHVTSAGYISVTSFGDTAPVHAAKTVLERNGVDCSQITLVMHQVNQASLDDWSRQLGGAPMIQTMATCADLCCATIPVNLGLMYDEIGTDYLLSIQIGSEMQATALLLRRNAS